MVPLLNSQPTDSRLFDLQTKTDSQDRSPERFANDVRCLKMRWLPQHKHCHNHAWPTSKSIPVKYLSYLHTTPGICHQLCQALILLFESAPAYHYVGSGLVLCRRQECQHPRYRQKRNKEMTKGEEETNSHVPAHFDPRYLRGPTWATPSRNSYVPAPCRCLVRHRWRPGHPQPPWLTTPLQLLSTVEQSRSGSAVINCED